MTPQTRALFESALALPEAERALLVERLLETLSEKADELNDDEWEKELDWRRMEIQDGKVQPMVSSELWHEE